MTRQQPSLKGPSTHGSTSSPVAAAPASSPDVRRPNGGLLPDKPARVDIVDRAEEVISAHFLSMRQRGELPAVLGTHNRNGEIR